MVNAEQCRDQWKHTRQASTTSCAAGPNAGDCIMPLQRQNEEQIKLLGTRLLPRREYLEYGSNLGAVSHQHLQGGGALIYDFGADRPAMPTFNGDTAATYAGLTFDSFQATSRGGPYTVFNGSTSVIYYPDAAWNEVSDATLGCDELFVWHWVNTTTIASRQIIASKRDTGNQASWQMYYEPAITSFAALVSTDGSTLVTRGNTLVVSASTWYFAAMYWQASALLRSFVGTVTDASLTIASSVAGIPATLFDGTAPLAIGSRFNVAPTLLEPWSGYIGRGRLEFGIPASAINGYASRLFHQTKHYYL